MLPRWHILFGAIFTVVLFYFAPQTNPIYIVLVFLSSFLIDFDHYIASLIKTKNPSLTHSLEYHRIKLIQEKKEIARGVRKKSDFHLFHTVEFHILVGLLSMFWAGFFYIFIGMIFHSLLDGFSLFSGGAFHRREFFFFNWARKRF